MSQGARATFMVLVVAGVLSGCGPLDKGHWAKGHVSGSKTFALDLVYGGNSTNLAMGAYADVPDGTVATVDVTGGQHWRCQGQFHAHPSTAGFPWDMENLPGFTVPPSSDPAQNFSLPPGSYTVTVRIPAMKAELKESATLEHGSGPNSQTLLYFHDPGCVLIADTLIQQKVYVTQYLNGMKQTASRLGKPDVRSLVDQAVQENALANQASDPIVVQSRYARIAKILLAIGDAVRAEFPDPPADIMQAINDTMPLLSQKGLR